MNGEKLSETRIHHIRTFQVLLHWSDKELKDYIFEKTGKKKLKKLSPSESATIITDLRECLPLGPKKYEITIL